MKSHRFILISLVLFCSAWATIGARVQQAQENPLTNKDVIKLLNEDKAKPEDVKTKIGNTATNFDLSQSGLNQLLDAKLDESVITAMFQAARSQATKYQGDWYVADVYYYLDSIPLAGTNFIPSLFSPIFPGAIYLLLLILLWLGINLWSGKLGNQWKPYLIVGVAVLLLLCAGAFMGYTNTFGGSYPAISVANVDIQFLRKQIRPGQDPCTQVLKRPAPATQALTTGSKMSGASNSKINLTSPGDKEFELDTSKPGQATESASFQSCRQPNSSPPTESVMVGKVIATNGDTGLVLLEKSEMKGGNLADYKLTVSEISRAGSYKGRISNVGVAPEPMQVTLNVSDWWPYFFVAVALGALFSNYTIRPQAPPPATPSGTVVNEKPGVHRETTEAFIAGVNSTPVNTISALIAVVVSLYANYSASWGTPTDYVGAFLGGAAITLALRGLAGTAKAASTHIERFMRREPTLVVHEVHLPPQGDTPSKK